MADEDFKRLSAKAYEISGIVLGDQKKELVYSRISRRIRKLGLKNFSEYCQHLEANHTAEVNEFVNSITTNLTSFFRESHHFEYLAKEIIPHWKKQNKCTVCRAFEESRCKNCRKIVLIRNELFKPILNLCEGHKYSLGMNYLNQF